MALNYSLTSYRPTLASNQQFGMVAFQFDDITTKLANIHKNVSNMGYLRGSIAAIMEEELKAFGKDVIEPTFKSFAPEKHGSNFESKWTWVDNLNGHLKDSLQTEWVGNQLILRMRKHGVYTINGNGSGKILPHGNGVLRIELDGGEVVYRRSVSPIGTNERGREALKWAPDAWNFIKSKQYPQALLLRIIQRIWNQEFPHMGAQTLADRSVFRDQYRETKGGGRPHLPNDIARHTILSRKRNTRLVTRLTHKQAIHIHRQARNERLFKYHAKQFVKTRNLEHKRQYRYYRNLYRHEQATYSGVQGRLGG